MSTIIMSQCWMLQGLSVTQKAVLISLADQASDDGVCWPAVGTVAKRCCMSERAVRSAMDHLEQVGLVSRERRFNSSSVYKVTPAAYKQTEGLPPGRRKVGGGTPPAAGAVGAPHAGGAPGAGGAGNAGGESGAGGAAPPAGLGLHGAPDPLHGAPPNHQLTIIEPSEEPPIAPPVAARTKAELKADQEAELQAACKAAWAAYRMAYATRYGVPPVRNEKVSSQMKDFVRRIGRSEAAEVAAWYVQSINEAWVVKACHDVGSLLSRAEAYRTQWATGRTVTATEATQLDRTQSNSSAADQAIAILRKKEPADA